MSIIAWIVLGLIAGFIGSKLVNKTGEGFFLDIGLGIVGAVIGGWLFNLFGMRGVTGLNVYSLIVAVSVTMGAFREHVTLTRTRYYPVDLADGTQIMRVIAYEQPQCQGGAAAVEGTFEQVKWRVKVNYSYEKLTAWIVTCFLGHEP